MLQHFAFSESMLFRDTVFHEVTTTALPITTKTIPIPPECEDVCTITESPPDECPTGCVPNNCQSDIDKRILEVNT